MLIEHPQDESGFAGQRNIGIQAATSDWLLHMDIDMRVPPDLGCEIMEAIRDSEKDGIISDCSIIFCNIPSTQADGRNGITAGWQDGEDTILRTDCTNSVWWRQRRSGWAS